MVLRTCSFVAAASALVALLFADLAIAAGPGSVADLRTSTHVHGLAVDRADPAYLLIATHHGLFRAGPDGTTERVSVVQDFMGFNPHPTNPDMLFASGHPAAGGNLGFVVSTDQGKTWTQVSPGLDGPVDFHQMAVSAADPATIYGVYNGIQRSRDGGKSWQRAGSLPDRLIDLSASGRQRDILYAATETGLLISPDGGESWKPLLEGSAVTMVEAAPSGDIYAFVYGQGLMQSREGSFNWTKVGEAWGQQFILHLAVDPGDTLRMFAATGDGQVLVSNNGGAAWTMLGQ